MDGSKSTFVLVPGAWHSPAQFSYMIAHLHEAGYPTRSLTLPSVGSQEPKKIEVTTDVAFIREKVLLPLLEDGKDVVLVMHSYGGLPGGAAAKGLSKSERGSEGQPGGVIGLVFLAAFLAREGDSLLGALGGKLDPWITSNEETGYLSVLDPVPVFYADVPEPLASKACASLLLHAENSFATPSPPSAWADPGYSSRRAYIRCCQDRAIPVQAQDMMIQNSGVEWIIEELDSSHCPFLSQPAELAGCLARLAENFAALERVNEASM